MKIKRDSISELKEKLANTIDVISDGKKKVQKLKKRMADFTNNDKNDDNRRQAKNPIETNRHQKQGDSDASEETKKEIRYSDYEIVTDNDEEIRIVSPNKNGKPPLK